MLIRFTITETNSKALTPNFLLILKKVTILSINCSNLILSSCVNAISEVKLLVISIACSFISWNSSNNHRNLGRGKGFALNGYKSNHYLDFILVTKSNKVIVVETKGSDRDNSDSAAKLRLGKSWARLSGSNYSYMMVFDKNAIDGAYNLEKAISLIKQM
jgi:type III restriction enzyme